MKTEISRKNHQPKKRYSSVYQQQGRMVTDADWNELVDVFKEQLDDALKDIVGTVDYSRESSQGGMPLHRGLKITQFNDDDPVKIKPGHIYVEGMAAEIIGDTPVALDEQMDFPFSPGLLPNPAGDYMLYADVWERTVTAIEDKQLLDPALHGADTCTRTQAMAQIKWCTSCPYQATPTIGNSKLTVRFREEATINDPCDPCAAEAEVDSNVGNYLFRLEVHDVQYAGAEPENRVNGNPENGIEKITLKWSSENGAEQYQRTDGKTNEDLPLSFTEGEWIFEFFNEETEKHLGVHLPGGVYPERGILRKEYTTVPPIEDYPYVRRWDGYCILVWDSVGMEWDVDKAWNKETDLFPDEEEAHRVIDITGGKRFTLNDLLLELQLHTTVTGVQVGPNILSSGDLKINTEEIAESIDEDDTVSTINKAYSAIAKAAAINNSQSVVQAIANRTVIHGLAPTANETIDANDLTINDVQIDNEISGASNVDEQADAVVEVINKAFDDEDNNSIVASKTIKNEIVLTSKDGRNIRIEMKDSASTEKCGLTPGTYYGSITLTSKSAIMIDEGASLSSLKAGFLKGITPAVQFVAGDFWLAEVRDAVFRSELETLRNAQANNAIYEIPPILKRDVPLGIEHHYLKLGDVKSGQLQTNQEKDRKFAFPPLTEMTRMFHVAGDGQEAMPGEQVPQSLMVGVANGEWPVEKAKVAFYVNVGNGTLMQPVTGGASTIADHETGQDIDGYIIETDKNGIVRCDWELGSLADGEQQVIAWLVDPRRDNPSTSWDFLQHPPIRFYANLSTADQVAYEPGCDTSGGTVHDLLVNDVTVPPNLPQLDPPGYYTVKDVLDAFLCKLEAKHIPFDNQCDRLFLDANNVGDALNNLCETESSGCCVRVEPGEDVQEAIDEVILQGGGCICLAHGVHEVEGPLLIHEADNLSIHGENAATVLRLRGTGAIDKPGWEDFEDLVGLGGILLYKSQNVSLESLLILGEEVPAVIWTLALPVQKLFINESLKLRDLTIINTTESEGDIAYNCALHLAHVSDVVIERCHLVGEAGIVAQYADIFPFYMQQGKFSKAYGRGVKGLRMNEVDIRYRSWGIWALRSDDWVLDDCDVCLYNEGDMSGLRSDLQGQSSPDDLIKRLPGHMSKLLSGITKGDAAIATGTAIKGFRWQNCNLRNCRLYGARGMDIWWWLRGGATGNHIVAGERGIHAAWMHDSFVSDSRIECADGSALSFVGSYRVRIEDNHIRAASGLVNFSWSEELPAFLGYVQEVAVVYSAISIEDSDDISESLEGLAFWMLLRETIAIMKLGKLVSALLSPFQQQRHLIYLFLAYLIYDFLQENESDIPLPLIALDVHGNDIEAETACISLQDMIMMGGFDIVHNRLHTLTGQALSMNANPLAANPQVLAYLWRLGFKEFIEGIPGLIEAINSPTSRLDESIKAVLTAFLDSLLELLEKWSRESEVFLESDNRIESNSVRSHDTAIETNLWNISIHSNQITMQEREFSNIESTAMFGAFLNENSTYSMGVALKDGSRHGVYRATRIVADNAALGTRNDRTSLANAVVAASTASSSGMITSAGTSFANALNTNNTAAILAEAENFAASLSRLVDSHGIWVKAPGCQVSFNHVIVPDDTDEETRGRGGIKISNDADEQNSDILVLLSLLDLDPMLGISETLISNNEVSGGFGHGLHIQAPIQLGKNLTLGYVNLKIRENEIVNMGGAGINVDSETLAVGLDIENNKVTRCGSQAEYAGLTNEQGGIVVENAALCRINDNRVRHCGVGEGVDGIFGVNLESIYGLSFNGNHLIENGENQNDMDNGGVIMTDVYGEVSVCNNQILYPSGIALFWNNSIITGDENPLPQELLYNLNIYLRGLSNLANPVVSQQEARTSRGVVQDNQFKMLDEDTIQAFNIYNIDQLIFTGNSCKGQTPSSTGYINGIHQGLIFNNNMLQNAYANPYTGTNSVDICEAEGGTVTNNVSNRPISVKSSNNMTIKDNVQLSF